MRGCVALLCLISAHGFLSPRARHSRALATARPASWDEYFSEEHGRPYWHNPTTGETTWDDPAAASVTPVAAAPATPAGTDDEMFLSEETVRLVLDEAKRELSTLFGNSAENRAVGITGDVSFSELDGGVVVLRFEGRQGSARPQRRRATYG